MCSQGGEDAMFEGSAGCAMSLHDTMVFVLQPRKITEK
jgi:hypothetical protein